MRSLAVGVLGASVCHGGVSCDSAMTQSLQTSQRVVDSLRPDKPGQARVFASDGSEFTAGEAGWMRGQLKRVSEACARGDQAEAVRVLTGVQNLIKSHTKRP